MKKIFRLIFIVLIIVGIGFGVFYLIKLNNTVVSIEVKTKKYYFVGQDFKSGNVTTVKYVTKLGGAKKTNNYEVTGYNENTVGVQEVTISFGKYTKKIEVEVLTNLKYVEYLSKTTYTGFNNIKIMSYGDSSATTQYCNSNGNIYQYKEDKVLNTNITDWASYLTGVQYTREVLDQDETIYTKQTHDEAVTLKNNQTYAMFFYESVILSKFNSYYTVNFAIKENTLKVIFDKFTTYEIDLSTMLVKNIISRDGTTTINYNVNFNIPERPTNVIWN